MYRKAILKDLSFFLTFEISNCELDGKILSLDEIDFVNTDTDKLVLRYISPSSGNPSKWHYLGSLFSRKPWSSNCFYLCKEAGIKIPQAFFDKYVDKNEREIWESLIEPNHSCGLTECSVWFNENNLSRHRKYKCKQCLVKFHETCAIDYLVNTHQCNINRLFNLTCGKRGMNKEEQLFDTMKNYINGNPLFDVKNEVCPCCWMKI